MTNGHYRPTKPDPAWCHDAVDDVSRTFAITVDRLEEPMATYVCVGYLCCRIADTIEDASDVPPADQVELLSSLGRVLDPDDAYSAGEFATAAESWISDLGGGPRAAHWRVVAEAPRVVATFEALDAESREIMRGPIRELVDGMAMFVDRYADAGGLRIRTIAELEEYCWYVAGTVGSLVTGLCVRDLPAPRAQELAANARAFALLLQLVNVARDVAADYREENNVYLPAAWLAAEGVAPDAVTDEANRDGVTAVVRRVVDRATRYLDDAQRYLELLPATRGNTLSAWAIPYFLAVGTLRELRDRPSDVLDGEVKVSREEVHALLGRFEEGVERSELSALRTEIAAGPLHER